MLNQVQKAYLAGFLDGDGSIYVRLKPNKSYRFGYQISPYIAFFQSKKDQRKFEGLCELIGFGKMRIRNDGIMEYTIGRTESIKKLLKMITPFLILKREQSNLMLEILDKKSKVEGKKDFIALANLIERFRELNYSKKRKYHKLTP